MKKVKIQKKKLTDFTELTISIPQQKEIKGGEDTVVIDDIIL